MKMLDLFSGIGGFSLAASWTGEIETVAFCEIEPFCQKVLHKHWPDVPIFPDIKELRGEDIGPVDIVCGGFPCQPFSSAGKRRGKEDDRYLWPEMFRIIQETKPTWVVGENVIGLIELALEDCFSNLETEGYEVQPFIIPACGVDAPHQRKRCWILARTKPMVYAECVGWGKEFNPQEKEIPIRRISELSSSNVAYPKNQGYVRGYRELRANEKDRGSGDYYRNGTQANDGGKWWEVEPNVGGTLDGLSSWLDGHNELTYLSHKRIIEHGKQLMGDDWNGKTEKTRTREILRTLRNQIGAQNLQWEIGRHGGFPAEEVLLSYLCKLEEASGALDNFSLSGAETQEEILRGLRLQNQPASSPYRPESREQPTREYPNALQALSRLLAHDSQTAWEGYCRENAKTLLTPWCGDWENGVPRVAVGVPNRVDRLRGLGNAIVPQIAFQIFKAIVEVENGCM